MTMRGQAALAMWWEMAPGMRAEFEHWHTHEHFPERLGIPGFQRASRWAGEGDGFFVLYELQDHAVLSSPDYLARLNAPTPWSRKLMPFHAHMVRSQCRVVASHGGVTARHARTVRFAEGEVDPQALAALARELAGREGFVGAHLLKNETPPIPPTAEQQIRGNADRVADCIFIACGYDRAALEALPLQGTSGLYSLAAAMVPGDPG